MQPRILVEFSHELHGAAELTRDALECLRVKIELGKDVAKQLTGSTKQFRITAQRPDGKKGDFGKLSMSAGARVVTSVRLE